MEDAKFHNVLLNLDAVWGWRESAWITGEASNMEYVHYFAVDCEQGEVWRSRCIGRVYERFWFPRFGKASKREQASGPQRGRVSHGSGVRDLLPGVLQGSRSKAGDRGSTPGVKVASRLAQASRCLLACWLVLALHPRADAATRADAGNAGSGTGYWHTRKAQLLDAADRPVRIAGVNWYGFETVNQAPGGLLVADYRAILRALQQEGFNTLRLPLSNEMLENPRIPSQIAFSRNAKPINTELRGLNSLEVLDRVIDAAGQAGFKVILDDHRSEAGDGPERNGLWFTGQYPESAWIRDWKMLAARYRDKDTVVGFDLRNEPHSGSGGSACWGCGGPTDWRFAAERAGNAVLEVNPRLLIFVEGVDTVGGDSYWWGGNLEGVKTAPVRLSRPGRLVYSPHDYGPVESPQPWFTPGMTDDTLRAVWHRYWGFIVEQDLAPVWVGEFGTPTGSAAESSPQGIWWRAMLRYLAADSRIGWTYWAANAEDRYGLLNSEYDGPKDPERLNALKRAETR